MKKFLILLLVSFISVITLAEHGKPWDVTDDYGSNTGSVIALIIFFLLIIIGALRSRFKDRK